MLLTGVIILGQGWANRVGQGWANRGPWAICGSPQRFVSRGSIQENLQIWSIHEIFTVNVSAEANLNRDLLPFTVEDMSPHYIQDMSPHYIQPSQSSARAKLIAYSCCRGYLRTSNLEPLFQITVQLEASNQRSIFLSCLN